jgi:outer membrane protein
MKSKLGIVTSFVLVASMAMPVSAHEAGTWIIKGGVGMVSPKSDNMFLESLELTSGDVIDGATIQVDDGTSVVLSATYMINDNWAVDILAAVPFEHDFEVTGTINGSPVAVPVGSTKHLPPTVSIQYHFAPDATFQPYVGLGVNYTTFFSESLESGIPAATGILNLDIEDSTGIALQFGSDWAINEDWLVSFDARWIQIRSDVAFDLDLGGGDVAYGVVLPPLLEVDPWVFNLTVGYKF